MAEQTNTRARHAAVLDAAKAKLDQGDVKGYWQTLEQISPDYAKLAGSVATGSFHGKGTRERLQDKAEEKLGRRFTKKELQGIAHEIAHADSIARAAKLEEDGHAGLTLKDTVTYHRQIFDPKGLPKDTYTLEPIAEAIGDEANTLTDTDPAFVRKSVEIGWEHAPDVTDAAAEYLGDTYDAYKRERERDIRDLEEEDPSRIENSPFGPHSDGADTPGINPDEASEAPEGVELGAEAARNAAEDAETSASQSAAGDATSDAVPESARAKAMAIVANEKNGRGSDQGTDQGMDQGTGGLESDLEDLMLKPVDDLTEDEAKALGQWSWKLKSNDPRRLEIENRRRGFYVLNYGDKPVDNDVTGRMIAPEPVRKMPEKPKALATPNGELVSNALQRFAARIAKPVHDDGETNVVKALQSGLSMLGDVLKVDGVAGPKTKAALKRTVAKRGAGRAEEAFGIGRFRNFAETERNTGGSASGLKQTVEKEVQPLFGAGKPKLAAETLQESLNDLGAKAAQERNKPAPEPLKVDGVIGPKTTDAFRSALADNGPEKLTKSYTSMLGFSD